MFTVTIETVREISAIAELTVHRLLEFRDDLTVAVQTGLFKLFGLAIFRVHGVRRVAIRAGGQTLFSKFCEPSMNADVVAFIDGGTSAMRGMHPVMALLAAAIYFLF